MPRHGEQKIVKEQNIIERQHKVTLVTSTVERFLEQRTNYDMFNPILIGGQTERAQVDRLSEPGGGT